MAVYVATQYVYDPGVGEMGSHKGIVVKAPSEEVGIEHTEDLMREGEPPIWPEYGDNVQWDSGAIELAPDVGEYGFYYTTIEDTDISTPVYEKAIAEGLSEEEAAERAYEAGQVTVGVEPLEQRTFRTRQEALDWLGKAGLYPPYRLHEVSYPWEENPTSTQSTKKLKSKLLR